VIKYIKRNFTNVCNEVENDERRIRMLIKTNSTTLYLSERTHIMGILNVTPDSFSDGGENTTIEKALQHARKMVEEGADMIDVGGESTRPDHEPISAEEEMERVLPVIEALKEETDVPISIDTYKAQTAEEAIKAGADMINDIWGAKKDPNMAHIAATYDVPIVLMHNRTNKQYESIMDEMIEDIQQSVDIVLNAGVKENNIIIDPGIGFGKELEHNYIVLNKLEMFTKTFPYPLLLGASRKSFITKVLDVNPDERDNATGATTCLGIAKGASIIRVHDVKRHVELAKMTDAIVRGVV